MSEIITVLIIYVLIVVLLCILLSYLKLFRRRVDLLVIRECLNEENFAKVSDKEDKEFLKTMEEKFAWYTKKWSINLTPLYSKRYRKVKNIIKKYNLKITVLD